MRKSIIASGLVVALGASAVILILQAPAGAQGGGTIVGEVKLTGTPPAPKTVKVNKDVEVCGPEKTVSHTISTFG